MIEKTKCTECGNETSSALIIHHIDRNRLNNDPSNLRILCCNCHATLHSKLRESEDSDACGQTPVKLDKDTVDRARRAGLSIQKICKDALNEKSEIMERAIKEKKNV